MRAAPSADKESKAGEMGGAMLASFRHKLAVYFLLLAVAPLTAAFWGFGTVTKRAEERRADSRPAAELRAGFASSAPHGKQLQALPPEPARGRRRPPRLVLRRLRRRPPR